MIDRFGAGSSDSSYKYYTVTSHKTSTLTVFLGRVDASACHSLEPSWFAMASEPMLSRAFAWKVPHWLESWDYAPSIIRLNRLPPTQQLGWLLLGSSPACDHRDTFTGPWDLHKHARLCSLSLLRPSRPQKLCHLCPGCWEALPLLRGDGPETRLSKANCISVIDLFSVSTF